MAKLSFDDGDGVWRTIGGKHIFIRTGESLSSAMKRSGKFKFSNKKKGEKNWRDKLNSPTERDEILNRELDESTRKKAKDFWKKEDKKGEVDEVLYAKNLKEAKTGYDKLATEYKNTFDKMTEYNTERQHLSSKDSEEYKDLTNKYNTEREKLRKIDDRIENYKKENSKEYEEARDKYRADRTKEAKEETSGWDILEKQQELSKEKGENVSMKEAEGELRKNKGSEQSRKQRIAELEKKKNETQGFLQKGAIQEEIDMLKDNFNGTKEEYREYLSKERERRLNEYQKEKAERLKVRERQEKETGERDYKMAHRPTETKITADNLINQNVESPMPKDVYEHPEYYSSGNKAWVNETIEQLNKVKNNPNGEITIYRATTGDKINKGDWITLSKKYAEQHNESQLDGKGKVVEMKVKAKDVQFAGDMLEEWGYYPTESKNSDNQITSALRRKAYQKYLREHPASKITFEDFKDMRNIK